MTRGLTPSKTRLRHWLLRVHLYGGLLFSGCLLVYGYSSLAFNHPWLLPHGEAAPIEWSRKVARIEAADDLRAAEAVRDRLGLMGWPLPWTMKRSGDGALHFEISRPGKRYKVDLEQGQLVRVSEMRTGPGTVLHAMHGMVSGIPNSRFIWIWCTYTELTFWFVLFSTISGIYLWAARTARRLVLWGMLASSTAATLGLMALLYWRG